MKAQILEKIKELEKLFNDLRKVIDESLLKEKINSIQNEMARENFWENQKTANKKIKELKRAKSLLEPFNEIKRGLEDNKEFVNLVSEDDIQFLTQIEKELTSLLKKAKNLKLEVLLDGEYDQNNAILSINSGAGGIDACDWAQILLRMYTRWAEDKNYEVKTLDILYEPEAGIKNAVLYIKGLYAYGFLKSETGVHRLVRISPFDANKRRHTSFASVEVIPEIEKDIDIQIREEDLKIETFRSSGPGGQHVNVTDSAVRITHIPTQITVTCQNERSQYQNKQMALKILKAKLFELEQKKIKEKIESIKPQKMKIEWGSQIRSYILHPYTLVKDHRTNFETPKVEEVLDGKIDDFIEAYLLKSKNA